VDLAVRSGEVLALLGENGAGKSTLMNVLYGLYRPDSGEIRVNGRPAGIRSPKDALALGIGMVPQHFKIVPRHSVAENIALGLGKMPFLFPEREVLRRAGGIIEGYGFQLDLSAMAWRLSAGELQKVEIVKALLRGASLLILDEPTAVLTDPEAGELFSAVRRMAGEGRSVIYITHKLPEVMAVSESVAVLREGRLAGTVPTRQTTPRALAAMMTDAAAEAGPAPARRRPGGEAALRVRGLVADGDLRAGALRGLDFDVGAGEILAVAGVSGNGQKELAEVLCGLRPARSGSMRVRGREAAGLDPAGMRGLGVRCIPEDRLRYGIVGSMSVAENAVLTKTAEAPFRRGASLDMGEARGFARALIAELSIKTAGPDEPAAAMSGGNVQKLVAGRELDGPCALVVACNPSYGLDVGAARVIRSRLLAKREEGCGVLLVSGDLDEVLLLGDRVAVIFEGRFLCVRENSCLDRRELMLLMGGSGDAS
jgi:simple sugar transport system ATP-binding protein